ncbi:hypothetical protein WN51_07496 [Melipona quadrifasciata]|uniref:Uncharacterized protein n=1 Tax=Melipona quadrifasciata TaxID=166423 RepID=A0A0M9A769_9HYME|nr:hypothetical protein WN51_07496 [Melipona quadrifasciata]
MSCVHYQQTNPSKEKNYFDGQYNRYVSPSYSPGVITPEIYRSGYCAGWRTLEIQGNSPETLITTARADSSYGDARMQTGRMTPTFKQEAMKHGDAITLERMQTKMKFLEDSNIVMQTRNQNLITENKAFATHFFLLLSALSVLFFTKRKYCAIPCVELSSFLTYDPFVRLKEERNEVKRLEKRLTLLQEELDFERSKINEMRKEVEQARKKQMPTVEANGTSTTNILSKSDRGVQVWAVCMACQRKLESCKKQPPTVTITKSELEVLEKDMQTLRDTIIAREEAWDKVMEREHNYRQQLTRLTTETITARHLSDTRYEELKTATNALQEKETELKSIQKDNMYLHKLIAKIYNSYQRGPEGYQRSNSPADINEKDQRFIEETVRRVSNGKSKQKPKSKSSCSERTAHSIVYQSLREKSSKSVRDQASLKEPKR